MTKRDVLNALNEIGLRFVRVDDPDPEHYKELGIAFGVAWISVSALSDDTVELTADAIDRLGLSGGSVQ